MSRLLALLLFLGLGGATAALRAADPPLPSGGIAGLSAAPAPPVPALAAPVPPAPAPAPAPVVSAPVPAAVLAPPVGVVPEPPGLAKVPAAPRPAPAPESALEVMAAPSLGRTVRLTFALESQPGQAAAPTLVLLCSGSRFRSAKANEAGATSTNLRVQGTLAMQGETAYLLGYDFALRVMDGADAANVEATGAVTIKPGQRLKLMSLGESSLFVLLEPVP